MEPQSQSWVQHCIEQIDKKIDQNHSGRKDENQIFYHHQITLGDGLEQQSPHTGKVKDVFDDDRSCEQEGKLETENGNHRDQGVAYRVSPKCLAPAETLGSCSADVIFLSLIHI